MKKAAVVLVAQGTPRTDEAIVERWSVDLGTFQEYVEVSFARRLEADLVAADRKCVALAAQVAWLEDCTAVSMVMRLRNQFDEQVKRAEAAEAENAALSAQVVELQKVLTMAKDYLYNPFEPDNQSSTYHKLVAALHSTVTRASVPPSVSDGGTP